MRDGNVDVVCSHYEPPADARDLYVETVKHFQITHCCMNVDHPRIGNELTLGQYQGEEHLLITFLKPRRPLKVLHLWPPKLLTWSAQESKFLRREGLKGLRPYIRAVCAVGTAAHDGYSRLGFLPPPCTQGTGSLSECPQPGLTFVPSLRFLQALLQTVLTARRSAVGQHLLVISSRSPAPADSTSPGQRLRLWPGPPKRCAPSCWPMPPRPRCSDAAPVVG